ncbi:S49 family peptidase [Empedobacter tilapiae]
MNQNSYLGGQFLANDTISRLALDIAKAVSRGEHLQDAPAQTLPVKFYNEAYQPNFVTRMKMEFEGTDHFVKVDEGQFVMVIDLIGMIVKYTDRWNFGTADIMWMMNRFMNNPNVVGFVINTDSGGGMVQGTPEFAEFLENSPKPVGVFVNGDFCSGAYWIGAGGHFIYASKHLEAIGSVGGYSMVIDDTKALENAGFIKRLIYGTKSTKKNHIVRKLDEENGEEYWRTHLTDRFVQPFIDYVKKRRPNISEEVFTGEEYYYDKDKALELGLIDKVATLEEAIQKVFELAKSPQQNTSDNTEDAPDESSEVSQKNDNTNSIDMKKFNNIATVLGVDVSSSKPFVFGKETVELSVENAEKLDAALDGNLSENYTALQATHQTTVNDLANANAAISTNKSNFVTLLEKAGLVSSGNDAADFTALTSKIELMAKGPANVHTNVGGSGTQDAGVSTEELANSILDEEIINR